MPHRYNMVARNIARKSEIGPREGSSTFACTESIKLPSLNMKEACTYIDLLFFS